MIVGLDIATTTGIAILVDDFVTVYTFKGDPIQLLDFIKAKIEAHSTVILERHVHFRNAKTTRSLVGRLGFIEWSLKSLGHAVSDLFPGKGRKLLFEHYSGLGFTKDECDGIILIHFFLKNFQPFTCVKRGDANA